MADLNLKAAFLPTERADRNVYWLGLGVIALIDALRLSVSGGVGLLSFLLVLVFLTCLHMNRLRDAGRSPSYVFLPLLAGIGAKLVIGLFAMTFAYMPVFTDFLATQGVDINDSVAVQAAAFDPALQAAHEAYMRANPQLAFDTLRAGAWPSAWAFWIAVGLVGRWFAGLPSRT